MDQTFPRQESRALLFDEYRRTGKWGTETFDHVLADACTVRWPDHRFIVASPTNPAALTFREFHERGLRLASALHAIGLRKGDVLAMEMPNWIEACILYAAAATLGLVVVPIIHIYQAKEVRFILRQSRAKAFAIPADWRGIDYVAMLQGIRSDLPELAHVIVVGDKAATEGAMSFAELEDQATDVVPEVELDPNEPHILAYTSGTTADPKGVVHSHNTLLAEVRAIVTASGGGPDTVFLCPNPIGHIAGIYSALIAPFFLGYDTLVLMDGWDAKWALELIQEHKITNTGGATFFLATLLNAPEFSEYDTSSLRLFGLGGAGVPASLVEQADAAGWWSMRAYGCTEHPSVTMGTLDDPLEKRAHTDGRPMIDVELKLVDDEGRDVAQGDEGEILTRGPDQFLGYMDPEMDREAFTEDGWFRTGDIGRLDPDGYLTVTDRKKDIIIRGGENISAREVEEALARHPRIQEAAVTAVSDARYGERVCAFVLSSDGEPVTLDEVRRHFTAEGIAKQKTPERIEMVAEFPRTLSGKIQKYVLRRGIEGT